MAFLAEAVGGIGGRDGGSIGARPPGIVELESSSSGERSGNGFGGEEGGDVVRVGKAGVGGIIKCKGEVWAGDSGGEYIGESGDGEGLEARDGEGVRGGLNSRSSVGDILVDENFLRGGDVDDLNFFRTGGEICLGDFLGEDRRGDLILPAFGRVTGGGLGLMPGSLVRGDRGKDSFKCFCLGGDFFVRGGDGGGGAALRAGIVIGDGTFVTGKSVGGDGDASFSSSLFNIGGLSYFS